MKKIKLVFVGCGAITRNAHLPAALRSPLANVYALVDADVDNANELVRMFGLNTIVTRNLSEVLGDADGFVLATPNDTHYSIARKILKRGKPVFIEKPITTTYKDAIDLCELADQALTFISVGYRYRFFPSVKLFKTLLDDNYFGKMRGFHCEMGSRGGWAPVSGYNLDRKRSGGGVLVINGTHFLDLILYWFGEPTSFTCQDDNYGNVEANCKGTLTFRADNNTFDGSFFFSKTVGLKNRFFIDTEKYLVEWSPQNSESILAFDKNHPEIQMALSSPESATGSVDYFQVQLEEFCRNITRIGDVTNDGQSAARSTRLIEGLYEGSTRLVEDWMPYRSKEVG